MLELGEGGGAAAYNTLQPHPPYLVNMDEREQVDRSSHELVRENKELRDRVSLLESRYHRCEQLAREWQNFGQYTARVLKNEMDTYEVKVQLLQEQVEKLASENKELREMCLYLDRSESAGEENKLTPPEATSLLLHTSIMSKLNKRGVGLPQFTGATSHTTLKDSRVGRPRKEAWSGMSTREALAEMKKRVERLEKEKLELIKSLSAAHLLTASSIDHLDPRKHSTSNQLSGDSERLPQPPSSVESLSHEPLHFKGETDESKAEPKHKGDSSSPELAINAATLLDICRRLDAAEQSSHKDPVEEAECATLRVLLNIAWQKLQEQQLKNVHNTRTTH